MLMPEAAGCVFQNGEWSPSQDTILQEAQSIRAARSRTSPQVGLPQELHVAILQQAISDVQDFVDQVENVPTFPLEKRNNRRLIDAAAQGLSWILDDAPFGTKGISFVELCDAQGASPTHVRALILKSLTLPERAVELLKLHCNQCDK